MEGDRSCDLDGEPELSEWCMAEASESESLEAAEASEDKVDMDDSRSEWARVYLTVVISSSSGERKETCFWAGNMGRAGAILRGSMCLAGLLARMERMLCGCL